MNACLKSFWNSSTLSLLNRLVSMILGFPFGIPTFLLIYTRLWSLMPRLITPEAMVFKSLVLQIIKSNNVLVDSVILVGLSIICCNWYVVSNPRSRLLMLLSFSFGSRSILKSPVMTVSMFSLSTFWRKGGILNLARSGLNDICRMTRSNFA